MVNKQEHRVSNESEYVTKLRTDWTGRMFRTVELIIFIMRSFIIYTFRRMLIEYKMEDEIGKACNTQEIKINAFKILIGNTEGKIPSRRHMQMLDNSIARLLKDVIPTGARDIYLLYKVQTGSGTHPPIQWLRGFIFFGAGLWGRQVNSVCSAKFRNVWSNTSTPYVSSVVFN